jgi:serine/threonine protein kinase
LLCAEGTYGIVFRARCKSSGKIYALKKLKMEHCPDGFPQTSVREVNVLLSLHHPNIVNVAEVRHERVWPCTPSSMQRQQQLLLLLLLVSLTACVADSTPSSVQLQPWRLCSARHG